MMMKITITLNPAIDKTVLVESLNEKDVTRVIKTIKDPAGKGINVAKVLHALNQDVLSMGFTAGEQGKLLEKLLKQRDLSYDFVTCEGETRENLKLVIEDQKKIYEINEQGPQITKSNLNLLISKIDAHVKKDDWIIISGSLPPGLDDNVYAKMITYFKKKCVKVFVDTSGDAFRHAILAGPTAIKPNLYELETFADKKLESRDELIEMCQSLLSYGIKHVICTLGAKGTLYVSNEVIYEVQSDSIETLYTVGAGDSFVGGFVSAMDTKSVADALVFATATARAAIKTEGTNAASLEEVNKEIPNIFINKVQKENE